jgi:hypothetical protein
MPQPSDFDPDAQGSSTALDALHKASLRTDARARERLVHPRRDQMWVDRTEQGYTLTLRRQGETLRLSSTALKQMLALVDIGPRLLARLESMPKEDEAPRLINRCLWQDGENVDAGFRLIVRDGEIQRVLSRDYTSVRLPALVRELASLEREGIRLVRWDLAGRTLRLALVNDGAAPVVLHEKDDKSVTWQPGVLVLNVEDGAHAVLAVPALVSPYGERVLPVLNDTDHAVKRRHQGVSATELAQVIGRDIRYLAHAGAPGVTGEKLHSLRKSFIPAGQARQVLESLALPLPYKSFRDLVLRRTTGPTSLFWLVFRILGLAAQLGAIPRTQLEIAIGKLVAARGRPASPLPPAQS